MRKIVTVVGARPQFVKAGPVSRAIEREPALTERLVHTGQHYDDNMSEIFFRELGLAAPACNLGISAQGHGPMTGRMLEALEAVLTHERPELVLVYGDTNSTLAGALAAAKLHIPVAHVEAGLRSFNRRMPEEINRVVTDHLASLHFCPTRTAVENLRREGVEGEVYWTGDVMFDATLHAAGAAAERSDVISRVGLGDAAYSVCTFHRAENTDDAAQLGRIVTYLKEVARERLLVIPLHPRSRAALLWEGLSLEPAIVTEPLGYLDFQRLLTTASCVYTDSGGLQKEAYFHGKLCVTLRDETEWVETVEHGWNRLWNVPEYASPRRPIDDYGQGDAAEKIVGALRQYLA